MEGVSGLVRWADVIRKGLDYERNRRFMTLDANAAEWLRPFAFVPVRRPLGGGWGRSGCPISCP